MSLRGMIPDRRHDIAELGRRRNALLPISHLPDSVLADVFDCCRQLGLDPHPDSCERLTLLDITQVCHSWRAISSSYGKLWTDINVIRPRHVQHWLARSARCALHVVADGPVRNSDTVCLVLEELPRIRTLSLESVCFTKEQMSTSNWINSPAPFLQSLYLRGSDRYTYSDSEDHDNSFCLTAVFLHRDLPSLKRLRIADSRFLSDCPKFPPSLTHLAIVDMNPTADWKPHLVSVMLAVLDTLPRLESLELSWIGREKHLVAGPVIQHQVTLPHLQDLTLGARSHYHFFSCLMNHLVFPSTAKINLKAATHDELNTLTAFIEDVGAKLNGRGLIGDTRPLLSFFMGHRESSGNVFFIDGWAVAHAAQATIDVESEPDVRILIDDNHNHKNFMDTIRTTCDALPLSHVENLAIGNLGLELKAETFMAISQNMSALHTLYIRGWALLLKYKRTELSACLTSNTSEDVKELFPSLRSLHLEFLRESQKTASASFLKFLMAFLASKKERGSAVEKLHLRACNDFDQSQKKLLRGLVKRLITDRVGTARR